LPPVTSAVLLVSLPIMISFNSEAAELPSPPPHNVRDVSRYFPCAGECGVSPRSHNAGWIFSCH
jgi:hypothetical protein